MAVEQAVEVVDSGLALPHVSVHYHGPDSWAVLRQTLLGGTASGRLVTDAQIAAATIHHGGILYTNDGNFAPFPGLRWINPLDENA